MIRRAVYISFFVFISFGLNAQSFLSVQHDHAKNLFNNKHYYDAITEYKRLLLFDSSKSFQYEAYYKIGECYKAGAKFDDAVKYFALASFYSANDDELFESKAQIIRTNIIIAAPHALVNTYFIFISCASRQGCR